MLFDGSRDVLVLAFFYVFRKPPSNDCSSILYARYTRRDAYKTDNFRPVGRRDGVFGRPNSLVRWIKNTVLIREKYSGRDVYNHNNNIYRVYGTPFDVSDDGASMRLQYNIVGT